MIDFAEIKERVHIDAVLSLLDARLKEVHRGEQWRGPCPCGKGDERALVITKSKASFYCWGTKRGGDVIALVAHAKGLSQRQAAELLESQFQLDAGNSNSKPTGIVNSRNSSPEPALNRVDTKGRRGSLTALDYLVATHPVIGLLGLSAASIQALGGGFAPKGTMMGRVLIPLRMEDGTLVGYLAIATRTDQSPLLKFPENLDERISQMPAETETAPVSEEASPEELRKMFRVVG